MIKVAVIGGGSLGTALAKTLIDLNRVELSWWIREENILNNLIRHKRNPWYLRTVDVNTDHVFISGDISQVIGRADVVIVSVPSLYVRETFHHLPHAFLKDKIMISTTKGLISHGHQAVSTFFRDQHQVTDDHFVFLTGPAHAEEIAARKKTYLTWACTDSSKQLMGTKLFGESFLQVRFSDDVRGLELATVLKNIYAICAGLCHSIGYGDNFISVLMSNAIREMDGFINAMVPYPRNIYSSAYIGDVMVTAFSSFSRNRTFGELIGRGYSVRSALLELNMIPEGYYSLRSLYKMIRKEKISMPVVEALYHVLYGQRLPEDEFRKLEDIFI